MPTIKPIGNGGAITTTRVGDRYFSIEQNRQSDYADEGRKAAQNSVERAELSFSRVRR